MKFFRRCFFPCHSHFAAGDPPSLPLSLPRVSPDLISLDISLNVFAGEEGREGEGYHMLQYAWTVCLLLLLRNFSMMSFPFCSTCERKVRQVETDSQKITNWYPQCLVTTDLHRIL